MTEWRKPDYAKIRAVPDPLLDKAERHARSHGFDSIEAYLQDLIDRDEPYPSVRIKAVLEALLLEGMVHGPATPFTADDWVRLRRRIFEVHDVAPHS